MDCGRESSMVGTILITPARFVWPYGGRTVYVSGSFTGWSEHWPMSPVVGYPTVFQIVCNLPLGYHQYKFIVDGEWRHDENQPFVTCNYGTVNTMLLTWEPDYNHAVLSPHVNNEALSRRISEADLEVSRQRINVFLSTHMAYELLPDSSKVIALDVDLLVMQAFHILYEQGISTAPLWDSGKGQFVGVLSALDFILIMRELGRHGSNLTEKELETYTISAWKEAKHGKIFSKRVVQVGPDDNLKDVTLKILQNRIATVPVTYSTSDDASNPRLLYLASLSDVFQIVCGCFGHSANSLPILQRPIYSLPLGTWVPEIRESNRKPLAILRPNSSLSAALTLFLQAEVSSIPIVDENDSLLDVYSRSDIIALAKDKIYRHINLEETTIHQALQLGQEPFSSFGTTGQRCHVCLSSDSLHKVMQQFAQPGVRRVVIVEAGSMRVEGIISLGDIFRFFLS